MGFEGIEGCVKLGNYERVVGFEGIEGCVKLGNHERVVGFVTYHF